MVRKQRLTSLMTIGKTIKHSEFAIFLDMAALTFANQGLSPSDISIEYTTADPMIVKISCYGYDFYVDIRECDYTLMRTLINGLEKAIQTRNGQ